MNSDIRELLGSQALYRLRKLFDGIDKDGSDTISVAEFTQACSELSMDVSPEELGDFMRSDVSDDGELDFSEFCRFYAGRLRKVFDEIDTDSSGEIGRTELQKAFRRLGYRATEREVRAMLSEVDEDHNEEISFTEFCNYFCSMPSPNMKAIMEKWASGLSIDTGSDLAPPPLPPSSVVIWRALLAGGLAGVVSRTSTAPLEKAKIVAQTQTSRQGQLRVGETLYNIWKKENWRGLFAGNGANCLRVLPFSALVCLAYYNMAKRFPLEEGSVRKNATMRTTSGAMAGVFASLLTHPMDVVRARLTVQDQSHKAYNGIVDALVKVAKNEKLTGLYKGIGPTLLAIAPFIAVQQISYDLLKHKATVKHIEPSVGLFLACGSLAGIAAQTTVYPLEVVRRRMQVAKAEPAGGGSLGLLSLLKTLGYKELFGGLSATYMKVIPAAAISLLTRDSLLGRLSKDK